MRKILKIAKLELSVLIYSPVVWLVLPIFTVLCAINFLDNLQGVRLGLSLGGTSGAITFPLFGGPAGLFTSIQQTLYLYMPILTMGIMSREISSGSIKLLQSSPVTIFEIVLGKYLAMAAIGLAFIVVLAIFGLIAVFSIVHVDSGVIISGLIGLFLLVSTYAAIGLFMSCLTSYQIVAAIATLAVFSALRFVGSVGQSIDIVRDLTYFLSISGRTESMIFGLISTKDVFYYLIIISLFLGCSMLYLKNQRDLKSWQVKAGRFLALCAGVLLIGYITSLPALTGYFDLSAGKMLTITENGQRIAKRIKGKLRITTYVNMLSPNMQILLPEMRNNDLNRQEMFKRFIPGIENHYVYYYHDVTDTLRNIVKWNPNFQHLKDTKAVAEKVALLSGYNLKDFITPDSIDKIADLKQENYLQVRKLEYEGKTTFLRFFTTDVDQYAHESEWMAALLRLTSDKMPHIAFLTGNNEADANGASDRSYSQLLTMQQKRNAMINQGFELDTVHIEQQDIPASATIVVLADPTVAFSDAAIQKMTRYINAGGNMLITTNPGRQAIINPVLQQLGVQVKAGMLVKPDKNVDEDKIGAVYPASAVPIDRNVAQMRQFQDQYPAKMQNAAALSYISGGPFNIQPLLESPAGGWNRVAPLDPNAPGLTFDAAAGDEKGVFPVVLTLSRKINNKEQHIIVSGDADYIDNEAFNKPPLEELLHQMNADVLFRWLTYGQYPPGEDRPLPRDVDLRVSREQLNTVSFCCKYLLPAIMVIMGIIILYRRRAN